MKYLALLLIVFLPISVHAEVLSGIKGLELSSSGIASLEVRCEAGYLIIRGVKQLKSIVADTEIEVEGMPEKEFRQAIEKNAFVTLEKHGKTAILKSRIAQLGKAVNDARINLTLEIPSQMDLKIVDGSGSIILTGIDGDISIDDDSGMIVVVDISGRVKVDDSSGSISIEDVIGNVDIRDGSGSIDIQSVKGDVYVVDGSGSISIRNIDGNVTVADGSGAVNIDNVAQNVYLREFGSGELNIERVAGKVTTRD